MTNGLPAGWILDIILPLWFLILKTAYWIVDIFYTIFGLLAKKGDIFQLNSIIERMFKSFALLIVLFAVFKLSINIVQALANPAQATDGKTGLTSTFSRIIKALFIMLLLVPLNFSNGADYSSGYTQNIKNSGILFGTLYELQSRIVNQGIIQNFVAETNSDIAQDDMGKQMATSILYSLVGKNKLCGDDRPNTDRGRKFWDAIDSLKGENTVTNEEEKATIAEYKKEFTYDTLLTDTDIYESKCKGDSKYAFAYNGLINFIAVLFIGYLIAAAVMDIAIRSLKLSILRVISPIPVIAYATPGSTKTDMLGSWSGTLIKTYVDLFIRLAMFALVTVVLGNIGSSDLIVENENPLVVVITTVLILAATIMFVKEAPKFVMDALGIKGDFSLTGGIKKLASVGAGIMGAGRLAGAIPKAIATGAEKSGNGKLSNLIPGTRGLAKILGGAKAGLGLAGAAASAYMGSKPGEGASSVDKAVGDYLTKQRKQKPFNMKNFLKDSVTNPVAAVAEMDDKASTFEKASNAMKTYREGVKSAAYASGNKVNMSVGGKTITASMQQVDYAIQHGAQIGNVKAKELAQFRNNLEEQYIQQFEAGYTPGTDTNIDTAKKLADKAVSDYNKEVPVSETISNFNASNAESYATRAADKSAEVKNSPDYKRLSGKAKK